MPSTHSCTSKMKKVVRMILFLDFDGVLHPEINYREEELFSKRPLFETVLRGFPDVDIVISSTWRLNHSLDELRRKFSPDIAQRIIDVTPVYADFPELQLVIGQYQRHVEIEGWLRRTQRVWEPWIALDDKSYLFKPFLKNLVRSKNAGLDEEVAGILHYKLKSLSKY